MAELREEVLNELREALDADGESTAIVRWYAVVDVVDDKGDRNLITIHSEGMTPWEFEGMVDQYESPFDRASEDA